MNEKKKIQKKYKNNSKIIQKLFKNYSKMNYVNL
jgi:hypothetical protein